MSSCCIVKCSARKTENQPQLSLHRFPKKEELRKKWLEAIGEENINPRNKEWHVCSLHFEESCFNRTLDLIRLHDNSVPTNFLIPKKRRQESSVLSESSNIRNYDDSCTSTEPPLQLSHEIVETLHKGIPKKRRQESSVLSRSSNIRNYDDEKENPRVLERRQRERSGF